MGLFPDSVESVSDLLFAGSEDLLGRACIGSCSLALVQRYLAPQALRQLPLSGSQVLDRFLNNQHDELAFVTSGAMSWVCTNQVLNRAAFLVDSVGFTVEDVIENIFGKRLSVWNL